MKNGSSAQEPESLYRHHLYGAAMHLVEGPENGFTSIPRGVYWAVVTVTTVGYGDVAPETPFGQVIAVLLMIAGYAIIAVPTGVVAAEMVQQPKKKPTTQVCPECLAEAHDHDAVHCKFCGAKL